MKYVLVVGGGKVGSYLTSLLLANGYTVRVIEGNRNEFDRLSRELPAGEVDTHGFQSGVRQGKQ